MTQSDRRPRAAYSPDPDRRPRPPVLAILVFVMASVALICAATAPIAGLAVGLAPDPEETVHETHR